MNNIEEVANRELILESIRVKNPKLYYRLLSGGYKPWRRKSKLNRNDLCPCGSGKKIKLCCGIHAEYEK